MELMDNLDNALLNIYMMGFNDELDKDYHIIDAIVLLQKAYMLGRNHALVGDEVDYQSDEEILKQIKQ